MTKVQRANVVLTVADDAVERYVDNGFNVISESGEVIRKAIPNDLGTLRKFYVENSSIVSDLESKIADLSNENKTLKQEIKKLKKKAEKDE